MQYMMPRCVTKCSLEHNEVQYTFMDELDKNKSFTHLM